MKRKLIYQMLTDWRSNIWMIIELIIVTIVLQFIFTVLYALFDLHNRNEGYNLDDVYVATTNGISKDSPDYQPYDSIHSYLTELDLMLSNMNNNPYVELAAFGSNNSMPYNYNYYGTSVNLLDGDSITPGYYGNMREMSPDVIRIMRLQGLNGETTEQLAQILERDEIIISNIRRDMNPNALDPQLALGKDVFLHSDSSNVRHVGAVAWGMQRSDYEPLYNGTIYTKLPANRWGSLMIIRVKPGMGPKFVESLTPADLALGNIYLTNLRSIDYMREQSHVDIAQTIRNFVICALFLLVVIFLGFLGTFWFRTQQRVGEIAVRKVNGATNRNIFTRFISEGLILFAISALIAAIIIIAVISTGILDDADIPLNGYKYFYGSFVITAICMSALIICGIWAPARRATRIDPSYALKDQ